MYKQFLPTYSKLVKMELHPSCCKVLNCSSILTMPSAFSKKWHLTIATKKKEKGNTQFKENYTSAIIPLRSWNLEKFDFHSTTNSLPHFLQTPRWPTATVQIPSLAGRQILTSSTVCYFYNITRSVGVPSPRPAQDVSQGISGLPRESIDA